MTRTEELIVQISADVKNLQKGIDVANTSLAKFEKHAKSSGASALKNFEAVGKSALRIAGGVAAAATALGAMAKAALNAADHVGEASRAAGLSTENFQRYAHAMNLAGVSTEEFERASIKLNVNLGKAAQGSKKQADALNALGVTSTDANVAFGQVADGLAAIEDKSERARLATVVFGEAGARMVETMAQGKAALDEAGKSLDALFTDEQIRAADELNDRIEIFAKTTDVRLKTALLNAAAAAESFLEKMGLIEAQTLDGAEQRVAKLREEMASLDRVRQDALANERMGGPGLTGESAMIGYEGMQEAWLKKQQEVAALEKQIADMRERAAQRSLTPEARARTPEGKAAAAERQRIKGEVAGRMKNPFFTADADASKAEAAEKARAKAAQQEQEARDRVRAMQINAAQDQADLVAEMERERLEKNAEAVKDFGASVGASLADMAVQGSSAADELKRRVVAALIQASIQALGGAGGGGGKGGGIAQFGLSALKIFAGVAGGVGGNAANGVLAGGTANAGGTYGAGFDSSSVLAGFATGGSFEVGGSGGTDSKRISFNATPGELIDVRRPGGTAGMGGGQPKVEQNVTVEVVPPQGMTATQERRRDASGRETIRLVVRESIQREAATRSGGANALLDDAGGRRAPRPGIS